MQLAQVLDVIEGLLLASEHPDIVKVDRYGTGTEPWGPTVERSRTKSVAGVKVTYTSTATAILLGMIKPETYPVPMPADMPPPSRRAPRLAIFVAQLLDVARPAIFSAWELMSSPTVGDPAQLGQLPYGISITGTDRTKMLLMAQATGAMVGTDPAEEPFPEYVIPEGVKSWHLRLNATSPARA